MSCSKHFLALNWKHHDWERHVTHSEYFSEPVTDMWGRRTENEHVACRAEFVCRDCGAVRVEGECTCDAERGEHCPVRLEWIKAEASATPHPEVRNDM